MKLKFSSALLGYIIVFLVALLGVVIIFEPGTNIWSLATHSSNSVKTIKGIASFVTSSPQEQILIIKYDSSETKLSGTNAHVTSWIGRPLSITDIKAGDSLRVRISPGGPCYLGIVGNTSGCTPDVVYSITDLSRW